MNSAGLSLGVLWLADSPLKAAYNASGPAEALTFTDLCHYLLATCASIEEVKAALGGLQVTTDFQVRWAALCCAAPRCAVPRCAALPLRPGGCVSAAAADAGRITFP